MIAEIRGQTNGMPTMAANVTKRLWEMGDIVDVLEAFENQRAAV